MRMPGLKWVAALVLAFAAWGLIGDWYVGGRLAHEEAFNVPAGSTVASLAPRLAKAGVIGSPRMFRLRARLFAHGASIKAGEFLIPAHVSQSRLLAILNGNEVVRHFVTVPEGLPSVMVAERLMAQTNLTGPVTAPAEGSVLPETYDYKPGEVRAAVLARMQAAMTKTLAEAWEGREAGLPITTPEQALALASIVEKETGKPSERPTVAGLYENRLRQGIMLQADPTIIYPITHGKPLGRRIRQSEISAHNGHNTYAMIGLPTGPITNPGKASILAVLHPAKTQALYMVADGTGGHAFANTLEEHNANVARWFAIRRAKGDL